MTGLDEEAKALLRDLVASVELLCELLGELVHAHVPPKKASDADTET